jgi:hypothetical protein
MTRFIQAFFFLTWVIYSTEKILRKMSGIPRRINNQINLSTHLIIGPINTLVFDLISRARERERKREICIFMEDHELTC